MTKYDYDLFTIGAGSGGVRASRLAAQYGAKVGVAEEYRVGGTCVIRGCVPKKLFVYASEFSHAFEDAKGFGWTVGETQFDWKTLVSNKDEEIDRLESHIQAVKDTLASNKPVGRKLDFLMQEFTREANTLGSKSQAVDTTNISVELKVLIEQMREQVQNIE